MKNEPKQEEDFIWSKGFIILQEEMKMDGVANEACMLSKFTRYACVSKCVMLEDVRRQKQI